MWMILAEIAKVVLTVRQYASILTSISSGKLVERFVQSYIVGAVTDAIVRAGVPLDRLDLVGQGEQWVSQVVDETAQDLAKQDIVLAPKLLLHAVYEHLDRLLLGRAVANGQSAHRNQARGADPVLLSRGEFEHELVDFEIAGAGMDFVLRRVYRSGAAILGPFGSGWDHSYNLRLTADEDGLITRLTGDLASDRFLRHPRFGEAGFSYFAPPDGVHDVVVAAEDGNYRLLRPSGIVHSYEPATQPNDYRIRRIEDRFGNYLEFIYSDEDRLALAHVNSPARQVQFHYDDSGRLTQLQDHTGRVLRYEYDDWGQIAAVVGPQAPGGSPLASQRYEYGAVGAQRKLIRIIDHKERVLVENEYEASVLAESFGRVIRQAVRSGETTFAYERIASPSDPLGIWVRDTPASRVWESSRNGHEIEHLFNEAGNELMRRERYVEGCSVLMKITRWRYNADGELVARLGPDGALTQRLLARDHLRDRIPWPDEIDVCLGDVDLHERMSFGNLLATVTRSSPVKIGNDESSNDFWEALPATKAPLAPGDEAQKHTYDLEGQLPLTLSDPRHTTSSDPLSVESARPGDAAYDPNAKAYLDHQAHLTRFEYGPAPRLEPRRTVHPNRTRPSVLDGVSSVGPIVEKIAHVDTRGRPLERVDARGYQWFYEYVDDVDDPRHGFLTRQLLPHIDLTLTSDNLDLLEVRKTGEWHYLADRIRSSGNTGDAVTLIVEGVRVALELSTGPDGFEANPAVEVSVDEVIRPPWNQRHETTYLLDGLPTGVHTIRLRDNGGASFAVGRVSSHVAVDYELDPLGRVTVERDALGNETRRIFDAAGRVTRVERGDGPERKVKEFEYEPGGGLSLERTEWRDENGVLLTQHARDVRWEYAAGGLLRSFTTGVASGNERRRITRHRYDTEDNLVETVDPGGSRTTFEYDALGREVLAIWGACTEKLAIRSLVYDADDRQLAHRNPRGALQANGYIDGSGQLLSGIDAHGRVWVETDALGHVSIKDHDALGNETVVRRFQRRDDGSFALLSREESAFDEHGDLISVTDAWFDEMIPTADPLHAPDAEYLTSLAEGSVRVATTEQHLDVHGHPVATRGPEGTVHRRRFDGQGRLTYELDADGNRTSRLYDGNGNRLRSYAADAIRDASTGEVLRLETFVETLAFDQHGRQVARVDPYGARWERAYDTLDNLRRETDPIGITVRYEYNVFGEQVARIEERAEMGGGGLPLSPLVTRRDYDKAGHLAAVTDPLGNRTEFRHDVLGRLVSSWSAADPASTTETREYDVGDNLVRLTDARGLARHMHYDLLNHLVRVEFETSAVLPDDALGAASATFAEFSYDAAGRRTRHVNDYCVTTIARDSRGSPRREEMAISLDGQTHVLTIDRQYDSAARLIGLTYPSGRQVSYGLSQAGRLTSIANTSVPLDHPGKLAAGTLVSFGYGANRQTSIRLVGGREVRIAYDGRRSVLEQVIESTTGTLWRRQTLRDPAGRVCAETQTLSTGSRSRVFAHDSLHQLTAYADVAAHWVDAQAFLPPPTVTDPLDSGGAALLASELAALPSELPPTFVYDDAGNRINTQLPGDPPVVLLPDALNRYAAVDGVMWHYDNGGNLRDDGKCIYSYDGEDQLVEVANLQTGQTDCLLRRDALGRVVAISNSAGTTVRVHDDWTPLVDQTGGARTEYVPAGELGSIAHVAGGGHDLWPVFDELGSLRLVLDENQAVVSHPDFLPYGEERSGALFASGVPIVYAGLWLCSGVALYHARHRTYRPDVGRWLQSDPAGFTGRPNLYLYAGNRPLDALDPTGLDDTGAGGAPSSPDDPTNPNAFYRYTGSTPEQVYEDRFIEHAVNPPPLSTFVETLASSVEAMGEQICEDISDLHHAATSTGPGSSGSLARYTLGKAVEAPGSFFESADAIGTALARGLEKVWAGIIAGDTDDVEQGAAITVVAGASIYLAGKGEAKPPLGTPKLRIRTRLTPEGYLKSGFAKIEPQFLRTGTPPSRAARAAARLLGLETDHAGHIVAEVLGGRGGKNFTFPVHPSANTGALSAFEKLITRQVEAGDSVFVRASLEYHPGASRPYEILYQARIAGGREATGEMRIPTVTYRFDNEGPLRQPRRVQLR
jgi:RHS repeat-associated protein